uniref:Uncharacterized protein n=1 Tax=Clastoptera arizonana TaxID=38151 RepID=A0A1B6EG15_9HEMI
MNVLLHALIHTHIFIQKLKITLHRLNMLLNFCILVFLLNGLSSEWVELPMLSPTIVQTFSSSDSSSSKINTNLSLKASEPTQPTKENNYRSSSEDLKEEEIVNEPFIKDELKKVNKILSEESYDSVGSKLRFLKQFERNLLGYIKITSKGLWTDRQSRGVKHKHGFGVELPLLTIALLTFAVFLVKIVQQIIQAFLTNPVPTEMMVIVPQPIRKRHRRSIDESAAKILQYMDDFKIRHIANHEL